MQKVASRWRIAELAPLHHVPHATEQGVIAVVERLHQHPAGAGGGSRHRLGLGRVGRERLLAEHVLAGIEGADGPLGVQPVGQGVVDGLDLRVGQQRLVAGIDMPHALACRESVGAPRVARRHRDDRRTRHATRRAHQRHRRNAGRAQDTDSQRAGIRHAPTAARS